MYLKISEELDWALCNWLESSLGYLDCVWQIEDLLVVYDIFDCNFW